MNRLLIGSPDKTNLLLQFLAEDFEHESRITIIDPTGNFAPLAANILPRGLTEQALYLDPADMEYPVGLNVLEGVPEDRRQPLTEQLCAYFDTVFPGGEATLSRATARYILANCLRVLLDTPGSTLLHVPQLLRDVTFRNRCLSQVRDPIVLQNWKTFEDKQYQSAIALLLANMGTFLMSPMIRNIVGQRKTTFSKVKVVIANLDRANLGDTTAKLLGGLLLTRSTGEVYITDLSFFATDHIASWFAQDRFTVALNFLPARFPTLREALLDIQEKYVFTTNLTDAQELAFYVGLANPRILVDLAFNQCRSRYATFIPDAPAPQKRLKSLQKRTRARYARPRRLVEVSIQTQL